MNNNNWKLTLLTTSCLMVSSLTANAEIIGIGDLPGEANLSSGYAVSNNGKTVAGISVSNKTQEAVRWTAADGIKSTGPTNNLYAKNNDISDNGKIIVGVSSTDGTLQATRWTQRRGLRKLGTLGGNSEALAISNNGWVISGWSENAQGNSEAFIWTWWRGMQGLGDLPGGNFISEAWDLSANGRIVVGRSESENGSEAFRWTLRGGMQGLGDLPGGVFASTAQAVSKRGDVVVGSSTTDYGDQAFRWTKKEGMQSIGMLDGENVNSYAWDVSGDGNIIVGWAYPTPDKTTAFIWTKATGIQRLTDYLTDLGIDLSNWKSLTKAQGISSNGRWVTGDGINVNGDQEGFVVDLKPAQ